MVTFAIMITYQGGSDDNDDNNINCDNCYNDYANDDINNISLIRISSHSM